MAGSDPVGGALRYRPVWAGVGVLAVAAVIALSLLALALLQTPLQGLLAWFDGQLADRLDPGAP